jgi:predicted ferric reductase
MLKISLALSNSTLHAACAVGLSSRVMEQSWLDRVERSVRGCWSSTDRVGTSGPVILVTLVGWELSMSSIWCCIGYEEDESIHSVMIIHCMLMGHQ